MLLHVVSIGYLTNYRLRLQFNDGATKEVDLTPELAGEVFEPLRDLELFRAVTVNAETNTIEWPNGADFAPEFLYEIGKEIEMQPGQVFAMAV
jgi:hypothetical protein